MVNCDAGKSWSIAKSAQKFSSVRMAHAVTGQYDVVAFIDFKDMNTLADILEEFQAIKGVKRTHTAVAIPQKLE